MSGSAISSKCKIVLLFVTTMLFAVSGVYAEKPAAKSATKLFFDGYEFLQKKQFDRARALFEEGLKADPSNPLGHFYLGRACYGLRDYACAEEHFGASYEYNPKSDVAARAKAGQKNSKVALLLDEVAAILDKGDLKDAQAKAIGEKLDLAQRIGATDEEITARFESIKSRAAKSGPAGSGGSPDGMVFVKGGCFEMGDAFDGGEVDEKPVHQVCVGDFYIGEYEVTVGEFREFVKSTGYRTEAETDGGCWVLTGEKFEKKWATDWKAPGFSQRDKDPVVCVSWHDAEKYAAWKERQAGRSTRLPSEAEWEYAARSGGKKWEKYAGVRSESELADYAWYGVNSGGRTHPVGQKKPNGLGIYDMTGNVWEWCGDWYDKDYYKKSPKDNPLGPTQSQFRVYRGGSWWSI